MSEETEGKNDEYFIPEIPERLQPAFLLYGSGGVGKSAVCATLMHPNFMEIFPHRRIIYFNFDRNGMPGFTNGFKLHNIGIKPEQVFVKTVKPAPAAQFKSMQLIANRWAEAPTKAKDRSEGVIANPHAKLYGEMIKSFLSLKVFDILNPAETLDFGSVDTLYDTDIVIIDGLTSFIGAMWDHVLAASAHTEIQHYGMVQNLIMQALTSLMALDAMVIVQAHAEISKEQQIVPGLRSGQALHQGLVTGKFTDVIYCKRTGNNFTWNTDGGNTIQTIARNVPRHTNLPATFLNLLDI